ncbi:MAG TPA: hypothetical protein VF427_08425 [Noviherbaspirillum sp.]
MKAAAWTMVLLLGLGAMTAIASITLGSMDWLASLKATLGKVRPYAIALHVSLIAVLWLKWPRLIGWLDEKGKVHPANKAAILASRHRMALLFLAVEVFVVIGFPFNLPG